MTVVGEHHRRALASAVAMVLVAGAGLCGCSSAEEPVPVAARADTTAAGSTAGPADAETFAAVGDTVEATTAPSPTTSTTGTGGAEPSLTQRSAPAPGTGTALLDDVAVGVHDGFERITFRFTGTARPGYQIQWVDGPTTADGSGAEVEVAGEARLQVVLRSASGFDLEAGEVVFTEPDRIPVAGVTEQVTDLVRTGDYEGVLTWVVGARSRVPFSVLTLTDPVRLVVDLQT